jgi:divalent metal cation (Fe/Co/Zn/Cd) transporter
MDDLPASIISVPDRAGCRDSCGAAAGPATSAASARPELVRAAFRLEQASVLWMTLEAVVAVWSGFRAGSVSLLAFLIELASAGVLIWRLTVELRRGRDIAEAAERAASRIAGGLLLALAAYVVIAAACKLWRHTGQTVSWPGLVVVLLAMPVMYGLARRKLTVAASLGSRAMRADAMESVTCGWLSLVVVVGLAVQALTGAWWVDAATSLGIVWFLVREGREAWSGERSCREASECAPKSADDCQPGGG